MSTKSVGFIVERKNWRKHRIVEAPLAELDEGQVRFRVDRFAITSNNISYAVTGDMLHYWDFFPAEEGWGRIPAMGFGQIIESRHSDVEIGERYFGFYPMATHLVIQPNVNSAGLFDTAPHREGISPAYNQYSRTTKDALYAPEHEDQLMLLRGLFMTSFLADDFLADSAYFGGKAVLVTSASSKTSIALAHCLKSRGQARSVGLTSARNREFVQDLGFYDEVVLYDEVPSLPADEPVVIVDMAGNAALRRALHEHYRDALRYDCFIGATHWEQGGDPGELPGPKPEFFFAPGQIQKRSADWGPGGLEQRMGAAWSGFRATTDDWLTIERSYGRDAIVRVYEDTVEGRTPANVGQVVSLWNEDGSTG
jgi:NADPH:quinone reductase-like Zn-dependent oxidoreductase